MTLGARLQARRGEIEQAAIARIYTVAEKPESVDPEYLQGVRTAISTTIDYALLAIEQQEEDSTPFPGPLLLQARRAARNGISIDAVLRRYMSGYTLFGDFVSQEAQQAGVETAEVQRLMRRLGQLFDRLLAAVAAEYERAAQVRIGTAEMRHAERLQRLLDGEPLDTTEFNYDFDGYHVGALAAGAEAPGAVRKLATALDRRLLSAQQSDGVVWAWMGGRWELKPNEIRDAVSHCWPEGAALALGEPGQGVDGWRLTHHQAKAAFTFAQQRGGGPIHYANVALLASTIHDNLLEPSLRKIFLEPLERERDGGETARETLRAYFSAGRNASSAAAFLGVSRRTVTNRLRAIEKRLGRPLSSIGAEIEIALRLDELKGQAFGRRKLGVAGELPTL